MQNSKPNILVVINPISGTNSKDKVPEQVQEVLNHNLFNVIVRTTEYAGHATEMAKQAIADKFYGVIAIGGDGTVNEVASALADSDVALGIIPCGSGNGLARHLGIPLSVTKALSIINEDNVEPLDYCTVNNIPFFCTCGVGFDAQVSEKFAHAGKRGPLTYVQSAILEYIKYRSEEYTIELPTATLKQKAFCIACGNASQYGNNAYITPHASMHDGLIDITIIHPFSPFEGPIISLLLFAKYIDQDTNISTFRAPELTIHRPKKEIMHIDGEPRMMDADLHIKCHKGGIKVFCPLHPEGKRTFLSPIEDLLSGLMQ